MTIIKRGLAAFLGLLSVFVIIAATATPAQALAGYREVGYRWIGDFAQARVYYNGYRNAAALWHQGATFYRPLPTQIVICVSNSAGSCLESSKGDFGTYSQYAGYVYSGPSAGKCIHIWGGISWNYVNGPGSWHGVDAVGWCG